MAVPKVTAEIDEIIEKCTTHGKEVLEDELAAKLKQTVQPETKNKYFIECFGEQVMRQLSKEHAQIRFGCVLVIEYLFKRCHLFREFICQRMTKLFKLCLQIDVYHEDAQKDNFSNNNKKVSKKLKPAVWTKKLHSKTIDCLQLWIQEFGHSFPQLKYVNTFLREKNLISFTANGQHSPNQPSTSTANANDKEKDEAKLKKYKKAYKELEKNVNTLIVQIDNCFELLIPKFKIMGDVASSDDVHFRPMQGLSFNIILTSKVKIVCDQSNNVLVDNLKDFCKQLTIINDSRVTKLEQRILKLTISPSSEVVQSLRNKMTDLKIKIGTIVSKFNEIEIVDYKKKNENDSEDDDFEEVPEREGNFFIYLGFSF